jgi:hypothetical protein
VSQAGWGGLCNNSYKLCEISAIYNGPSSAVPFASLLFWGDAMLKDGKRVLLVVPFLVAATFIPHPFQRWAARAGQTDDDSAVGCLSKKSGKLKLTDENGKIYDLTGYPAGLGNQIGDELEVSGTEDVQAEPLTEDSLPEITLKVTAVRTILHRKVSGVRPSLSSVASWVRYRDKTYGVSFSYPRTFEPLEESDPHVAEDFVSRNGVVRLQTISVPREAYPNSNFLRGSFTSFVNPTIRSEGTCRQFASFWPEHTSTFTVNKTNFTETVGDGVAAGTASDKYYLHAYQNGLCYEFAFDFDEEDGTGMPLVCAVQWVSAQNERELMKSLLSQVTFSIPNLNPTVVEKPRQRSLPSVVTFAHDLVTEYPSTTVKVSWSTRRADYVQLHYPCRKELFVSGPAGSSMRCGTQADRNFPPNGSTELHLGNFASAPIPFALTIEPFLDGVGYSTGSKTMTVLVNPHP